MEIKKKKGRRKGRRKERRKERRRKGRRYNFRFVLFKETKQLTIRAERFLVRDQPAQLENVKNVELDCRLKQL